MALPIESVVNPATVSFLAASAAAALWCLLDYFYAPRHHPDEPPVVRASIPYIGHLIGLLWYGTRYYQITSAKCKLPIYTLNMLNGKVYTITSPNLVSAVNRNSKVLAFNPFIAQLGKRITGHDEATSRTVQHNLNGENGSGYVIEVHDGIVAALAPGKNLERMSEAMLREASTYFDKVKDGEVDLFAWTRQMVTMCSTRAIYGPENPFSSNPNLVTAFWNFECDLNLLLFNIAPNLLAPKGNRGRSEVARAFQLYFEKFIAGKTQSSAMIKARYSANTHHGITPQNQGRLEVGTLLGILANTIPAVFYMLVHVYSEPALLRDIRDELETTSVSSTPGEMTTRYLRILSMRDNCHLLHSTFQELLRVHALGAGARFVREDVMLDNQYFLKKGMVVQMPTAVMHSDPTVWGTDVLEFRPRRFLNKHSSTAYRPFGGGASLCPGRHFVTLETLALTACMVLRYDIASVDGHLSVPPQKQDNLATNVFPPEKDVREFESKAHVKPGNLDFDARVPIPISVFPSTYRSDAATDTTTETTKVEGVVRPPRTSRVGREDTREEIDIEFQERRPRPRRQEQDDIHVYEQRNQRYPEAEFTRERYSRGDDKHPEVELTREKYDRPAEDNRVDIEIDRRNTRDQAYESQVDITERVDRRNTRDQAYESQLDITEREYRRRIDPTYEVEYRRQGPREDIEVSKEEVRTTDRAPRNDMGYYDDDGNYHSFRRGVERAADRVFHPFHHHHHHHDDKEEVIVKTDETGPTRVSDGVRENVRFVEPRGGFPANTVTIPCHFIRVGDLVILQGRPCQVIRISTSAQTGQLRYLGVDLFTRQLHEESSFVSNPGNSVIVQSMLGPVFKQYRILDMRDDGRLVCMTESGDVKQGLSVVDQGGLYGRIDRAFADGRGSVRALVVNDGGRELVVDYKVIHGSRL